MWTRDTAQTPTSRAAEPTVNEPQASPRPPEERRVVAWIGKSLLFRGDLVGREDMTIDGRVEGTVELRENTLTIGPDANIQADIVAKAVTIHGSVVGSVTATETIFIGETGKVEGNITSRRLAMADGALIKGQVTTGGSRGDARSTSEAHLKAVG